MESYPYIRINNLYSSFFLFLLLALTGCNSQNKKTAVLDSSAIKNTVSEPSTNSTIAQNTALNFDPTTKIIRNATVKMQVKDFRKTLSAIENTTRSYQAYIASSNETHREDKLETTFIIRVPSANLDILLNQIISQATYLDFKNITSEDVSAEFVDISARIKSKKAVEERYLAFLKDAKNIKEMLELENEIRKIREEVEATQARINYINNQTAYSTINLEVYQPTMVVAPTGNSYWVRVANAFGAGWEVLLSLMIGLIYIWPLLLVIVTIIYFWRWFMQKYPPVK